MARFRAVVVLLAFSLALTPLPGAAQAPRPAATSAIDLFPDDAFGYLEVQLRAEGEQGQRLDRLVRGILGQPELEARWAWLELIPLLVRNAAVGAYPRGETVEWLAALGTDEPAALLSLVLLSRRENAPRAVESYGGSRLYQFEGDTPVYMAAAPRFLLLAGSRDALVAGIDRARAGAGAPPGLATAADYRTATARLPAARIATGYFDGAGVAHWVGSNDPAAAAARLRGPRGTPPPELPLAAPPRAGLSPAMTQLAGMAGALALTFEADGLRAVVVSREAGEAAGVRQIPSTDSALGLIPQDALVAVAGHGVGSAVNEQLARRAQPVELPSVPGVDWQSDLLSWMDGEWGLAVAPPEPGAPRLGDFPVPGATLLFEVADPPTVEGKLRNLARVAASQGLVPSGEPREERQGDVQVRRLTVFEGVELTWGYLGRWLFISTGSSAPLARAQAAGGLVASPEYARVARYLPRPNTGVAYANIPAAVRWLESLDDGPLGRTPADEQWWRPLLARMGTLATAAGVPRDAWQETVVMLELEQ
jgi:hypothetical protein